MLSRIWPELVRGDSGREANAVHLVIMKTLSSDVTLRGREKTGHGVAFSLMGMPSSSLIHSNRLSNRFGGKCPPNPTSVQHPMACGSFLFGKIVVIKQLCSSIVPNYEVGRRVNLVFIEVGYGVLFVRKGLQSLRRFRSR